MSNGGNDFDSMLSENIYIEIYDMEKEQWLIVCPFTCSITRETSQHFTDFKDHIINGLGHLYVLSYMQENENSWNFSVNDTAINHLQNTSAKSEDFVHNFIKSKNSCALSKEFERIQNELGCSYSGKGMKKPSDVFQDLALKEKQNSSFLEMSMLPTSL